MSLTNTVLEEIQRILLTLRRGASFTLPGLTIWAFDWNQTSLRRTRQQASKANCVQYKTSSGPKIIFPGGGLWMDVSKSLSFSIAPKSRIFASRIKNCSNQCQFRLLFWLQKSVINRPRRRWVQPRRRGSPFPQPGCRPLARFPQMGSTRAPRWGICRSSLQSRAGRLQCSSSPSWIKLC